MKEYQEPYRDLYDMLRVSAERFPAKAAVIDDRESVIYAEMKRRVDALAGLLREKYGLRQGMQAGILMVNSAKTLIAFYALAKLGCIAVMINTKYRAAEIRDLLASMEVRIILCDGMWTEKVFETAERNGIPVLAADEMLPEKEAAESGTGPAGTEAAETAAPRDPETEKQPSPEKTENADLPVVIMHTSGTTGKPKGIMVTQRNIMEAAYGYREVQGLGADDITVLSVPLFHILGLSCVSTLFIYIGGTIVLSSFYKAEDVLRKIRKYKATHFHSVPAIYLQLLAAWKAEQMPDTVREENAAVEQVLSGKEAAARPLDTIRTAICGGAPISQEDADEVCVMIPNAVFRRAYGMTETAGSGTLSAKHKGPLMAVPNMFCTVEDTEHRMLPPGQMGEIVFHGTPVARGRWEAEDLPDDAMYSGDVGYMDEEGHVFVVDRVKDIINRGGEKIFPKKIETLIEQFPGIRRAAVYAFRSPGYGEEPAAAIIPEEGESPDPEELRHFLKERIATFEMPVRFSLRERFPVTENGKVRKAVLRAELEEKLYGTESPAGAIPKERKETGAE
ncbi:MAG: acyl--CoA ligase [Lachnospiraceae bacterium]|nr:acyl--CoA ligase [Lachnospiraceae bacterium]